MALLRRLRIATVSGVGVCIMLALAPLLAIRAAPPTEYEVKAIFLFNFLQFVDWPATALADPAAPLVIGVLGVDPFGSALDDVVHGEAVGGRPLSVVRYRRAEEIETCHVLFIARSERERLEAILRRLQGRPILTVGDFEGFVYRGGMIRFLTLGNKIRLRINLDAARDVNLTISSKLLRPAEIVTRQAD